ncbi:MerR family transcriptional regulator [Curtobacterium sp. ISL-83]|uniref:MerR family transcriptional regulator n=1 Tax=Curtobacterium sp. ISL-83 TaxID=2819145 RepID=UPI001BE6559A|nr:MerR family transcriptional regulator [Curtobacterium sp. ISL-83]MBT2503390.1 MerR family transcriptional regulator [Curtobacterium sp. ISL-83]
MHIGELAERAGMSLRTIRHYDEVGLLVPSGRTAGGFRVYTEQDLERLLVIRRMKPLGFTLDEMAELLRVVDGLRTAGASDSAVLAARLDEFVDDARARHATLVERAGMAEEFIETLGSLGATLP